jgi:hypothetical protein
MTKGEWEILTNSDLENTFNIASAFVGADLEPGEYKLIIR